MYNFVHILSPFGKSKIYCLLPAWMRGGMDGLRCVLKVLDGSRLGR